MNFGQKVSLSLFLTVILGGVAFAQVVEIPDPNLRAAVREALDITDRPEVRLDASILRRHLRGLDAGNRSISDLTGLEHATSLTSLLLHNNDISDVRALAPLVNLTRLRLHGNQINDLSPLANLTKLTTLLLDSNSITDVSPLANLTRLTTLGLGRNNITDISPLTNLTQLPILYLKNNNITDISPLANLVNLERLELQNNRITDITPLENLTHLEHLDIQNNPIFDADSPVVDIPDPNLRTAIRETLKLPDGVPVNRASMQQLTGLDARGRGISDLTGLEHATSLTSFLLNGNDISDLHALSSLVNLTFLRLDGNQINGLGPLANLTQLTTLVLGANRIVNISPLAYLTELNTLTLGYNRIADISPLANLTQLSRLDLRGNYITDIGPLANLFNLEWLELQFNHIADHSPVHNLSLDHYIYDETCDMPPLPLLPRLQNRTYPSIFAPWGASVNQPHLSWTERLAQHDMHFKNFPFRQIFFNAGTHWEVRGPNEEVIRMRDELIALNPNMVFLTRVKMANARPILFPADWPYWVRDAQGNIFEYPNGIRLINFTHPDVQDMIVQQAIAVSKCGLYDGIVFDWWTDHAPVLVDHRGGYSEEFFGNEAEQRARDNILQRIHAETRPDFLIIANTNDRIIPRTGRFINGGIMEAIVPTTDESLKRVRNSLHWLEQNLRTPRINSLQGGSNADEPPDSPTNLRLMRTFTTLSLTHSDGYIQFAIGTGNDHYWYDFWDANLGQPVGAKTTLYDEDIPGLYIREFSNGWAVYNHSGESQVITLPEEVQGVASGLVNTAHTLPNFDGEMYLRVKPLNPADVNGDGVVNILDLVVVAQGLGTDKPEADVNRDGVVNILDLVQVAGAIGGGAAAPSAYSLDPAIISAADVERWLALAQSLDIDDANLQQGIRFLEGLFAALTPKETTLLPNYPNPFNPETWIPYRLAEDTNVTLTIYDTNGIMVRHLDLGHQSAGFYESRTAAIYWDGRNDFGEGVASGVYFYHLSAGDYSGVRKMLIVK